MSYDMPVYVVVWDDSVEHSDGAGRAVHKPARQVRVGWMVQHDGQGITVASEYSHDDGTWRGEHFIPNAMIVSITKLDMTDP